MDPRREAIETCAKVTAVALLRLTRNDTRGARYLMEARLANGIHTSSELKAEAHLFWNMVAEELAAWDFINQETERLSYEEPA